MLVLVVPVALLVVLVAPPVVLELLLCLGGGSTPRSLRCQASAWNAQPAQLAHPFFPPLLTPPPLPMPSTQEEILGGRHQRHGHEGLSCEPATDALLCLYRCILLKNLAP